MNNSFQAIDFLSRRRRRSTTVLAVASGKGGVGKTCIATNLAVALAKRRHDVMLLDADIGLANVDVLLGLQPKFDLSHVLEGQTDLASVIVTGPHGLRVIPATSGKFNVSNLSEVAHASLVNAFDELVDQPDILVVDAAPGISPGVARYIQASQEALIVVCDEPSSLTDAYALIKVLSLNYGVDRFRVITNRTANRFEAQKLFRKLFQVVDRFLDVSMSHLGDVPDDKWLRMSVQEQRAVVDAYPRSPSSQAIGRIAKHVESMPKPSTPHGAIQFFLSGMVASNDGQGVPDR